MNETEQNSHQIGTHNANSCSVEGCDRYARAKGLCIGHHRRLQKHGDPKAEVPLRKSNRGGNVKKLCFVEGCDYPAVGKGLCAPHGWRLRKHGSVRSDIPLKQKGVGHNRKSHAYTYWWTLRMGCTNPKSVLYPRLGALGISVCEEWGTYDQFVKDLGERPSKYHVLILNEGEKQFAPGTCRWELKGPKTTPSKYKITYETAEEIRRRHAEGGEDNLPKNLAAEFGISTNNVYVILKRQTWK